jgi:hypothetical protein
MKLTIRRRHEIRDWVERYDIYDYFSNIYPEKIMMIGYSRDGTIYKKIIR